jgi:mycothiol S-conjugate amidase
MAVARRLTLLTVNGHPDDETTACGSVMARYAAEGLRVVCVVATLGEVGEIVDPDLDTPANRARLGEIREQELHRALECLGSGIESHLLGYRDSGTMGTAENDDPRSLWQADVDEAAGRLVRIIRSVRADVIVAPNSFGGDGHPDHIRVSQLARLAYERAGDPAAYPEHLATGLEIHEPAKLYEIVFPLNRREKLARALGRGGVRGTVSMVIRAARFWTFARERHRRQMAAAQGPITTRVDVGPYHEARYAAMREHRTQIPPDGLMFALSPEERRRVSPMDDFTLVESRVETSIPEDDLFAGLR